MATDIGGLGRRDVLAAGLAGLAFSGVVAPGFARASQTAGERFHTYMRLRGGLTDRVVISTLTGRYYGVVEAEVTPLFGVIAAVFTRHRPRPDGGYDVFNVEQAYFTDPETGQVLDQWLNPYTGETVAAPATRGAPRGLVIRPDLTLAAPPAPGLTFDSAVTGPTPVAGDIWMIERTLVSVAAPGQTKPFHYSEINGYGCARADLARPARERLTVRSTYESVVSWRPWMKMGERPGHLLGTGHGGVDVDLDQLPAAWLEATRRQRPDLITAPQSLLAPF